MAYNSGGNLPHENASKLGHLSVLQSSWVNSLVDDFESVENIISETEKGHWSELKISKDVQKFDSFWAVDGSYVEVKSGLSPKKEVAFVKTAIIAVDRADIEKLDQRYPHPLHLKDLMSNSAIQHATVFPLRNIKTSLGNNYDSIRNIVKDSMTNDSGGAFYETLKWLVYSKWSSEFTDSPKFQCPHCGMNITGLIADSDSKMCEICKKEVFLTDIIGFHLDMQEDIAPLSVATSYMLVMEHLMLFTSIRILWDNSNKKLVSNTLFIKDGPLTLRSQFSKLVPYIRNFLQYAKDVRRPIHLIGQEKSGYFADHLDRIANDVKPFNRGENLQYSVLTHEYIRKEVYQTSDLENEYGRRTNYGEKVFVKVEPNSYLVLNIPPGDYNSGEGYPTANDLIGLERILASLPGLISHRFTGALYPVELANGISSMSNYPSAKIFERFIEDSLKSNNV